MWRKIRYLKLPPVALGTTLLLAFMMLALGYHYVHAEKPFFPGETSAMSPKDTPLQGYVSHAEFEQECAHCHAPLHCVTDTKCQDCHTEVALQRSQSDGLHGKLPGTSKCQTCHPEHHGREVVITDFAFHNVDHAKLANFSLVKHQEDYQGNAMGCESCHSQERFAGETLDCLSCHIENDHDYMAGHMEDYGMDCVRCHDGADRMRDFDHEQVYALQGAHAEAECQACHAEKVFAGISQDCIACHEDPELHEGKFGLDCARCHTATAWQPAKLTRHAFQLSHGGETQLECQTCHLENFTEQTCYNCHDHEPQQMAQVHLAEGITEYENCSHCHPSGQAGEAARLLEMYGNFNAIPKAYQPGVSLGLQVFQNVFGQEESLSDQEVRQQYLNQLKNSGNSMPGNQPSHTEPGQASGTEGK